MLHLTVTAKNPLQLPPDRYLLDGVQAGHFLVAGCGLDPQPAVFAPYMPSASEEGNADTPVRMDSATEAGRSARAPVKQPRVLIIRSGGMGDVLFITPALRALRQRFPQHRLTFATLPAYQAMLTDPALEGVEVIDYPVTSARAADFDFIVPLEETIESDHEHDAVSIFARALGLELAPGEQKPRLRVPSDAILAAQAEFPKQAGQRFYGIQLRASHACRTWPVQFIMGAAQALMNRDPQSLVFMFGLKRDWEGFENVQHPRVVWLPEQDLSLTETLAVMTLMDGFIAPDSGLLHCAGALDIPAVGLFGPYRWQQRTACFPSVYGLNGVAPCAPCHHNGRLSAFPPDQPCAKHGACVALGSLTPEKVVSRLLKQMDDRRHAGNGTGAPPARKHYTLPALFGPVKAKGDVHPELDRAADYHLGSFGHGSSTVEEAHLLYALVLAHKPKVCVETGTETGWTACHIAAALETTGLGHLTTLELDPQMRELAAENLAHHDLAHRVTICGENSLDWLANYTGRPIDFALLDTHIPLRSAELAALRKHLAPDALVCVHDTATNHPMRGATKLLDDLRASGMSVVHVPTPRGFTVLGNDGGQR